MARIFKTALLISALTVSACGGWGNSRLNPSNWFGGSTEIAQPVVDDNAAVNPLMPANADRTSIFSRPDAEDRSVPIHSVTTLRVDPTASGAIVLAQGLAVRQGAFGAVLRPEPVAADGDDSELTLSFRVIYPVEATPTGNDRTRTVNAAYTLSADRLETVRVIRVVGAENARETRRK